MLFAPGSEVLQIYEACELRKVIESKQIKSSRWILPRSIDCLQVAYWVPLCHHVSICFSESGLIESLFHPFCPFCELFYSGAPLSWGDILIKNLIPVTIGNAIAGAFVAWFNASKCCALCSMTDNQHPLPVQYNSSLAYLYAFFCRLIFWALWGVLQSCSLRDMSPSRQN